MQNSTLFPDAVRHRRLLAAVLPEALVPSRCAGCGAAGSTLCAVCRGGLEASSTVRLGGGIAAACRFDGVVRSIILGLKYGNRRSVAPVLARLVVRRLALAGNPASVGRRDRRFDVVTWAPTASRRASKRGYDQAELLARHIARELGVPCRRLLFRVHGDPQTGRSRAERLAGPSFRSRRPARPLRVLLVDDVVTTGATLIAAEHALRAAGVHHVTAVAVAATPSSAEQGRGGAPGRLDAA